MARKAELWSARVTRQSSALDLEEGVMDVLALQLRWGARRDDLHDRSLVPTETRCHTGHLLRTSVACQSPPDNGGDHGNRPWGFP